MPRPQFEVPTGAVDGVNTTYTLSLPYTAGTVVVFLRGLPRIAANDDGFTETTPATGVFTMKEAPLTGDAIEVFYKDTVVEPGEVVTEISGEITAVTLNGTISSPQLAGSITSPQLAGSITSPQITGNIDPVTLTGVIECLEG